MSSSLQITCAFVLLICQTRSDQQVNIEMSSVINQGQSVPYIEALSLDDLLNSLIDSGPSVLKEEKKEEKFLSDERQLSECSQSMTRSSTVVGGSLPKFNPTESPFLETKRLVGMDNRTLMTYNQSMPIKSTDTSLNFENQERRKIQEIQSVKEESFQAPKERLGSNSDRLLPSRNESNSQIYGNSSLLNELGTQRSSDGKLTLRGYWNESKAQNVLLSNSNLQLDIPASKDVKGKPWQPLMKKGFHLGEKDSSILNIWKRHFGVDPSPREEKFVRIIGGPGKKIGPSESETKKQVTPVVQLVLESTMTNFCGRGNPSGLGGYPYRSLARNRFLRNLEGRQCYQIQPNEWICEDWGSNFIHVKLHRGFWTANCFTTKKMKRDIASLNVKSSAGNQKEEVPKAELNSRANSGNIHHLVDAFNDIMNSGNSDHVKYIPPRNFPLYRADIARLRYRRSVDGVKYSVATRTPQSNSRVIANELFPEYDGGKLGPPIFEKDEIRRRALNFDAWKILGDSMIGKLDGESQMCRTQGRYFPRPLYELETCSWCYTYAHGIVFQPKKKFQRQTKLIRLGHWSGNVSVLVNGSHMVYRRDDYELLRSTFREEAGIDKWTACCRKAVDCCDTMLKEPPVFSITTGSSSPFCPRTWDGWQCWGDTPNGTFAYESCPDYIYFEAEPPPCTNYATKWCEANGTWFRKRSSEWTNYSTCSPVERIQKKSSVHVVSYAISMAALMPALLIFTIYKQLRVPRIKLHQQLFLSLFAHAVSVTLFRVSVVLPDISSPGITLSVLKENGHGCKILLLITRYLRLTNYAWMFCEGLYLHRLITAAFVESNSLIVYYLVGWGLPLIPTSIYACLRALFQDETCWVIPVEQFEWVFYAPALVSLIVNFLFLVNIIRILLRKLRTAQASEPSQYRKAVKATLFLVPLFGVHLFATIYRPKKGNCEWIEVYSYLNLMLDGLQGFLVAIIFCYANNEIHNLLRRSYLRFRDHKRVTTTARQNSLLFFARHYSSTNDSESPGHQLIRFTFQPQRRNVLLHPAFLTKDSMERNGPNLDLTGEQNKCDI